MSAAPVWRYVVTHVGRDGLRVLSFAAQGRNTYPDYESAASEIRALLDANGVQRLSELYGPHAVGTFAVRGVRCWPGHFDPQRTVFDE